MLITAEFSIQHVLMTIVPQAILLKLKTLIYGIFPQKRAIRHQTVPQLLYEFHFEIQVQLVQATAYTAR